MIAAGEVVERPASVVKELCENSIDAKATQITVEIKKGGVPYIRITDNGCGIDSAYLETAFLRHATSKIEKATDLDAIGTLGFRGEALASICAVSRMEVFSKTQDSEIGRCLTLEGGKIIENDDAGCPDGTTMIVRNLFFNTPARMKFLKNDATETSYVTEVVNKLVLSHPEISFHYINNGKTVLKSSGDGKLISSIYTVFGADYTKNMTAVSYEENGVSVEGYIGNSRIARKDRRHQIFFVNSRNIISRVMSAAVGEAFKNSLMTGRFPVCILKAELDPKTLDVNVHPAKVEVRFQDEKKVYHAVYWACHNALAGEKFVPEINIPDPNKKMPVKNAPSYEEAKQMNFLTIPSAEKKTAEPKSASSLKEINTNTSAPKKKTAEPKPVNFLKDSYITTPVTEKKTDAVKEPADETRFSSYEKPKENLVERKLIQKMEYTTPAEKEPEPVAVKADTDFRLVGQVFGTFILIQRDNEMLIIDQHAAHERLCYEELLEEFRRSDITSQLMLLPVTMTLSPSEMAVALENKDFLYQLGFETDEYGASSIIIRSTPGTFEEQDIKDLISDIITLIIKNNSNIHRQLFQEALHMIACKKALKGNTSMTDKEMKVLAERVLSLGDGINTCPHGRPIIAGMSKYAMEKQFKRIL